MRLLNIRKDFCEATIPVRGWHSVEYALLAYAYGEGASREDAPDSPVRTYTEAFGAVGGYLAGRLGEVTRDLLERAHAALQSRDVWGDSFDYDGPGPFFKSGVEIMVLDRAADLYALNISARADEGLARSLRVKRPLMWCSVELTVAPEGDQFVLDFGELFEQLFTPVVEQDARALPARLSENAGGLQAMAERVVQVLTAPPTSDLGPHALLWVGEVLKHTLYVKDVPSYYDWDYPGQVWNADGTRMFGPLKRDRFLPDRPLIPPPRLVYEVRGVRTPEGFRFSLPLYERGHGEMARSHIGLVYQRLAPLLVQQPPQIPERTAD